jgi:hypothetical protein
MRRRILQKKRNLPPFLSFITALLAVIVFAFTPVKAQEEEWRLVYEAE